MNVLFSIAAFFPFGTPYASRALNICRILNDLGHRVVVFCDYVSPEANRIKEGISEYKNIEIHHTTAKRTTIVKALKSLYSVNRIKEYIKSNKVDLIISSQSPDRFAQIYKLAKGNNIPIIVELCEKFHYSNWTFGRLDFRCLEFLKCWEKYYSKADGYIVISKYLMNCFNNHEKPIVRIPTIIDTEEFIQIYNNREYSTNIIKFIFSGGLGHGKDKIIEWLDVIQNDKKRNDKYQVNIFGPSYKDIEEQRIKMHSDVFLKDSCFIVHGRIPQKDVPQKISENNFGLILRPNRESSNAGFPTKIAEYLAVGTPVISNPTSDIKDYIIDGENGFIVQDLEEKTLRTVLNRIDNMSVNEYKSMCNKARESAVRSFDYRNYKDLLDELIISVMAKIQER